MGGQPKSKASSQSSAEVRRLWEEPTEVIPQNQAGDHRNPLPFGERRMSKATTDEHFDVAVEVHFVAGHVADKRPRYMMIRDAVF